MFERAKQRPDRKSQPGGKFADSVTFFQKIRCNMDSTVSVTELEKMKWKGSCPWKWKGSCPWLELFSDENSKSIFVYFFALALK